MTVTTTDVRIQLGNPTVGLISDDIIAQQIKIARDYIIERRIANASDVAIDNATIMLAAYNTAVAYYDILHRDLGRSPEFASAKLSWMWQQFQFFAEPVLGKVIKREPVGDSTESLLERTDSVLL